MPIETDDLSVIEKYLLNVKSWDSFADANEYEIAVARRTLPSKAFRSFIDQLRDMYAGLGRYDEYVDCSEEFDLPLEPKHLETLLSKQVDIGNGKSFKILADLGRQATPMELAMIAGTTCDDDERAKALAMLPDDLRILVVTCVSSGFTDYASQRYTAWVPHFKAYLPDMKE